MDEFKIMNIIMDTFDKKSEELNAERKKHSAKAIELLREDDTDYIEVDYHRDKADEIFESVMLIHEIRSAVINAIVDSGVLKTISRWKKDDL